jgi:hypothetical protein
VKGVKQAAMPASFVFTDWSQKNPRPSQKGVQAAFALNLK